MDSFAFIPSEMFTPIHVPKALSELYEVHDWNHASAILSADYREEFAQICDALLNFQVTESQIKALGGNESDIPKIFSSKLRPEWIETRLTAKRVVDDKTVDEDTHKVDYVRGRIAFDLEWNSKDQTFDRDLNAFRAFWEFDRISVAILVTRSNELDPYFRETTYINSRGQERPLYEKFGGSTTHMRQLMRRVQAGRSGGCPLLIIGITPQLIIKDHSAGI